MFRKVIFYIFAFFSLCLLKPIFGQVSLAQEVDLRNFIAQPDFPTHSLSTGEVVSYESLGSGDGTPVRQFKNDNYEQFFLKDDGIYRREDTSWAPFAGAQAICSNGNKAAYTLDSSSTCATPGQTPLTDGARWLPNTVVVGQSYPQQTHNILSFDTKVPAGANSGYNINTKEDMVVCGLQDPQSGYPACGQTPSLKITGYYEAEEFTFCTGATNTAPVVTISGDAGAGAGDGFAYMEGCGLVGFSDANMGVGITDGCGISVTSASEDWTCSDGYVIPITQDEYACALPENDPVVKTLTVRGRVTQATWTDTPNPDGSGSTIMKPGLAFRNAVVTNYTGDPCTVSKLGARSNPGRLVNIDYRRSPHVSTDSAGYYSLVVHQTEYVKERFIAYSCDGQIADLYKCDLTKDTDGIIDLDVDANCKGTYKTTDPDGNAVRPYLELRPVSPGENIPLTNFDKFSVCMEAPYAQSRAITERAKTRVGLTDPVEDENGPAEQKVVKYDVDRFFLPRRVSPYLDCDPANPAPYEMCMPQERKQVLRDEFNYLNPLTSLGRAPFDATSNVANVLCGPMLAKLYEKYNDNPNQPSPFSLDKNHPQILPSAAHIRAMNSHLRTGERDVLGKTNVFAIDNLSRLVNNPARLEDHIKVMDPDMAFAYNEEGDPMLLGEVEVPYKGGKTLYELKGYAGTGKRYTSDNFPGMCFRAIPFGISIVSGELSFNHNLDDSAETIECGEGDNKCARDYPINGILNGDDTTSLRSYASKELAEQPADKMGKLGSVLTYGDPQNPDSNANGYAGLMAYPNDARFQTEKTVDDYSPKEMYGVAGDNECRKIGFPVVNFCMCPQKEHVNSECPNPLNDVNILHEGEYEEIKNAVSGKLVPGSVAQREGIPTEFLNVEIKWGGIGTMISNFIGRGWSIFGGSREDEGGQCIQWLWGTVRYPGYCQCPECTANASNMVVSCRVTDADGNVVKDRCACENICEIPNPDGGDPLPCNADQRLNCPAGVECTHIIQDQPPLEWGEPLPGEAVHPDCIGNVENTVVVEQRKSTAQNLAMAALADALLLPGETRNSCDVGGVTATVQANYEEVIGTATNDVVKTDTGQYVSCVADNLYKKSDPPYYGDILRGDAVIGARANPISTCNAFNVDRDGDGVADPISFEESLESAANTIAGDRNKQTSVLIDEYGPYCIVEFSGSPYAWNVTDFIDNTAVSGLDRVCENQMPPKVPAEIKPEHAGLPQSCVGFGRSPGDVNFDYYRGALNAGRCPLKTHAWPDSITMDTVFNSLVGAYYNGNYMDSRNIDNPALKALREQQLPIVLAKAKEKNINPYILVAFWGTESGWSNRPSCYNSTTP